MTNSHYLSHSDLPMCQLYHILALIVAHYITYIWKLKFLKRQ